MTENWLAIVVGIYLAAMILYGHYRGFIRLAVSAVSLIATLILVQMAVPHVTDFLKNHTQLYSSFEESMAEAFGLGAGEEIQGTAGQRALIEDLPLPKQLKDSLLENNNGEVYQMLGVDTFTAYVGRYLANSILSTITFLVLFVLIFALFRIITIWLDLVARLPVLCGMNKIAGAVLGGLEGLFFLWIAGLFVTVFSATDIGGKILAQIESSAWLSFLYDNNLLSGLILTVARNLF